MTKSRHAKQSSIFKTTSKAASAGLPNWKTQPETTEVVIESSDAVNRGLVSRNVGAPEGDIPFSQDHILSYQMGLLAPRCAYRSINRFIHKVLAYIDNDAHTRDASQAARMKRTDEENRRGNNAPMTAPFPTYWSTARHLRSKPVNVS